MLKHNPTSKDLQHRTQGKTVLAPDDESYWSAKESTAANPSEVTGADASLPQPATEIRQQVAATGAKIDDHRSGQGRTPQLQQARNLGVDLAIPVVSTVSLMEGAEPTAVPIKMISGLDTLVLIDRKPRFGRYDVIDVPMGKEGWVDARDVRITISKHHVPTAKFQEEYTGSDAAPSLSVSNKTDTDLTLTIEGVDYVIPPRKKLPVSIPVGRFRYYATEPGVIPSIGEQEFKSSHRYTWNFWVETSVVPIP